MASIGWRSRVKLSLERGGRGTLLVTMFYFVTVRLKGPLENALNKTSSNPLLKSGSARELPRPYSLDAMLMGLVMRESHLTAIAMTRSRQLGPQQAQALTSVASQESRGPELSRSPEP